MSRTEPFGARGRFRPRAVPAAFLVAVLALALSACAAGRVAVPARDGFRPGLGAKNVILFIGDGMGFEHVRAAGMYMGGPGGTLTFEAFPFRGSVATANAEGGVPDSAAAATAMATGFEVHNTVVSVASPGDGSALPTVLELFTAAGRSTGLVTTSYVTDATPAAFAAHRASRTDHAGIDNDYLARSRPNVLFGGGKFLAAAAAAGAGYTVVRDRAELTAMDTESQVRVAGLFGSDDLPYERDRQGGLPRLSEMTRAALRILDNDPDGFFLMVEGGRIDHASHANDMAAAVLETIEFSNAVAVALDWAGSRADTLIVVTADHETGGLRVLGNTAAGVLPKVAWAGTGHTGARVPVYAKGIGADRVAGAMRNTDIFRVIAR